MFHRPVGLSTSSVHGANINAMPNMATRGSSLLPQNENAMSSAKGLANHKTPARSSTGSRRAFGDISNNKASNVGGNLGGKAGSNRGSNQNIVLKPKASSTKTPFAPSNGGGAYQSRLPTTGGNTKTAPSRPSGSLVKRSHPWSKQPLQSRRANSSSNSSNITRIPSPSTIIGPPSSSLSHKLDFPVPKRTTPSVIKPRLDTTVTTVTSASTETFLETAEPVDDVELPAGRTWDQQLLVELRDDEDDYSTSSMGETLDRRTMWDDWRDNMHRQREQRKTAFDEEEDLRVQQEIDQVMKQAAEDEDGLECLFDLVEDLNLDPKDKSASEDLDLLLEDDDWSAPASSLDGIEI